MIRVDDRGGGNGSFGGGGGGEIGCSIWGISVSVRGVDKSSWD